MDGRPTPDEEEKKAAARPADTLQTVLCSCISAVVSSSRTSSGQEFPWRTLRFC